MKLKEFFVQKGWALGFAEVRRYLSSDKVLLNGEHLSWHDADIELKDGDVIEFGRRKVGIYNA